MRTDRLEPQVRGQGAQASHEQHRQSYAIWAEVSAGLFIVLVSADCAPCLRQRTRHTDGHPRDGTTLASWHAPPPSRPAEPGCDDSRAAISLIIMAGPSRAFGAF